MKYPKPPKPIVELINQLSEEMLCAMGFPEKWKSLEPWKNAVENLDGDNQ